MSHIITRAFLAACLICIAFLAMIGRVEAAP